VETHGGKIWAENNNSNNDKNGNLGAIFYFTLPLINNNKSLK
jgi:hypothetical protein